MGETTNKDKDEVEPTASGPSGTPEDDKGPCPSCGRDRKQSNEGTVLLNFANTVSTTGRLPEDTDKAREGLGSKDAHAMLPQSLLRPAAKSIVSVYCARKGQKTNDVKALSEFIVKNWSDFKSFYVGQMKSMVMRPPGREEHDEFQTSMEVAEHRLPPEIDYRAIQGMVEKLKTHKPGDKLGDNEKFGPLGTTLGMVKPFAPLFKEKEKVEDSVKQVMESSFLSHNGTVGISEPCDMKEKATKEGTGSAAPRKMVEWKDQQLPGTVPIKTELNVRQSGAINKIVSDRLGQITHLSIEESGSLLSVSFKVEGEPDAVQKQFLDENGNMLGFLKETKDGLVNLMGPKDLANIDKRLNDPGLSIPGLFKGIMGAPFTVGKQCAYCEQVRAS